MADIRRSARIKRGESVDITVHNRLEMPRAVVPSAAPDARQSAVELERLVRRMLPEIERQGILRRTR